MVNLLPNLEAFITEIKVTEMFESISEKDGLLSIKLRHELFNDPAKAMPFLKMANLTVRNLHLENYIKMYSAAEYTVDLSLLHEDRLRDFFHKDTSQMDVTSSIDYLQKLGWTEKQFSELGLSRASFYRYRGVASKQNSNLPNSSIE
jgi:hypothetical protein